MEPPCKGHLHISDKKYLHQRVHYREVPLYVPSPHVLANADAELNRSESDDVDPDRGSLCTEEEADVKETGRITIEELVFELVWDTAM